MRTKLLLTMFAALCSAPIALADAPAIEEVPANVRHVYIPFGFDTNDQVEVVLHGYLPNSCYKPGPVSVSVDHGTAEGKGRIFITPKWIHHQFDFCNLILVEYKEVVNVGYLKKKNYEVVLLPQNTVVANELAIAEATTTSQDDYTYLPVESMHLASTATGQELVLQGTFPAQADKCIRPSTYKAYRQPSDVVVVLPIAEVVDCPEGQKKESFEYRVPLQGDLEITGNTMIHVRALNGRSVNQVYDQLVITF